MGQIWDFFQISFNIFWPGEPKCTESDLKKYPDLFILNLTLKNPRICTIFCSYSDIRETRRIEVENECQIWPIIGSYWSQIGQIRDFLDKIARCPGFDLFKEQNDPLWGLK